MIFNKKKIKIGFIKSYWSMNKQLLIEDYCKNVLFTEHKKFIIMIMIL